MPLSLAMLVFAWTLSSNVRCGLKLLKQDGASLSDCTTLDLGGAMLGNAGLVNLTAALARDGGAPGLRTIKLNNNELSDAAFHVGRTTTAHRVSLCANKYKKETQERNVRTSKAIIEPTGTTCAAAGIARA
tara:strand:- start:229 stop:621 length:393 start_codon:yes stop_codon:yes gene_type:complete